jgi:hypothetical protein
MQQNEINTERPKLSDGRYTTNLNIWQKNTFQNKYKFNRFPGEYFSLQTNSKEKLN